MYLPLWRSSRRFISDYGRLSNLIRTTNSQWIRNVSTLQHQPITSSYAHGASKDKLIAVSIGQVFDNAAALYSDREAFVFIHQEKRKSFLDLKEDVDKFAGGLLSLGLGPGDFVGVWSLNCYEWLITQYAVAKCGMILVHLNPACQKHDLEYCLQHVPLNALVASEVIEKFDYYETLAAVLPTIKQSKVGDLRDKNFPSLKHVITMGDMTYPGTTKFRSILDAGTNIRVRNVIDLQKAIDPDSPSNILFTSGTTGMPKAVVLSHLQLVNNAYSVGKILGYGEGEQLVKLCCPLPLFHVFGLGIGSLVPIVFGNCTVFPSQMYLAQKVGEVIQKEGCTALAGTPTMLIDFMNLPNFHNLNLTTLQKVLSGGSSIPLEVAEKLNKKLGKPVLNGYGMTEGTCGVLFPKLWDKREIQMVKGPPLDHIEVKIVNDKGKIVPRGEQGQLLIRGYNIMLEYFKDPAKTVDIIKNSWLHSGDIAVMDDKDYVQIIGRGKDMINKGGENISPLEIENFLHKHPKVAEAQIVGVPDARYGEQICAFICPKRGQTITEAEIKDFCKNQIAHFKVPEYVLFTDAFPKTAAGKVKKHLMQDQAIKKLNIRK